MFDWRTDALDSTFPNGVSVSSSYSKYDGLPQDGFSVREDTSKNQGLERLEVQFSTVKNLPSVASGKTALEEVMHVFDLKDAPEGVTCLWITPPLRLEFTHCVGDSDTFLDQESH